MADSRRQGMLQVFEYLPEEEKVGVKTAKTLAEGKGVNRILCHPLQPLSEACHKFMAGY